MSEHEPSAEAMKIWEDALYVYFRTMWIPEARKQAALIIDAAVRRAVEKERERIKYFVIGRAELLCIRDKDIPFLIGWVEPTGKEAADE